jgi:raffinose/stachyose/melibiose transport system substrate-binding protein
MRKTFLLVMSIILVFSLTLFGCTSNDSETTSSETTTTESSTSEDNSSSDNTAAETDSKVLSEKEFTIRLGAWFIDERPHMKKFKEDVTTQYKELYPNGVIQWDITLGATFFDKLNAQLASNSAPDVFFYQRPEVIDGNFLADLSDEPWVANMSEIAKKSSLHTRDGKVFALPMGSGASGVWYNKDLFDNLGLQAPKTIQEWFDVNQKIKESGVTPIGLGFKDAWTVYYFFGHWVQSRAYAYDSMFGTKVYNGEITMTDPFFAEVYNDLQYMKENGHFNNNALSIDWPQSAQLFASGETAMIIQGPWMPGANADNIAKGGYKNFQIGYFPLMSKDGKATLTMGAGNALAVNAKTELMDEAKALVNLVASQEIYGPIVAGDGNVPALTNIKVEYADPVMDMVSQAVASANIVPYAIVDIFGDARSSLEQITTKVVSGEKFDVKDMNLATDAFEKSKDKVQKAYETSIKLFEN